MSAHRAWPITVRRRAATMFIGVPDRLGKEWPLVASPDWPTLEEVAGDNWLRMLLSSLLPADRVWAWWARMEVFGSSGLASTKAPASIVPSKVTEVMCRQSIWRRKTLAIVPRRPSDQERVLHWAGMDTEHLADAIATAGDSDEPWPFGRMIEWPADGTLRNNAERLLEQMFERILLLEGGHVKAALSMPDGDRALEKLSTLARKWKIEITLTGGEYAW